MINYSDNSTLNNFPRAKLTGKVSSIQSCTEGLRSASFKEGRLFRVQTNALVEGSALTDITVAAITTSLIAV